MTETPRCNAAIDGPRVGRHVVAWRRYCQRKVLDGGPCWQHGRRRGAERLEADVQSADELEAERRFADGRITP